MDSSALQQRTEIICLVRAGGAELGAASASVNIFPCRGSEMVLV
jgi:hypothetical protein